MTTKERLTYAGKNILAPMVRIGTLPTRLLALDYGADIVYSEEIIDHKLLQCQRVENKLLGTIDFVLTNGTVVFRTCDKEKDKVVFQMGTSDPERALRVAKLVENDVAGIDVNMGCPKEFSILGGMGAALLTEPEKVHKILTTLIQGVSIPVTCKIRILPELEDTVKLVKVIESTGVVALAVHGRLKEERPRHSNHDDVIRAVVDVVKIPVIANGGSQDTINEYKDIDIFRKSTNASSVMIARAAQWNTSVFRKEGLLPIDDVIEAYLKYCIEYDSTPANVKYNVQQIMHNVMETERGHKLMAAIDMADICDVFGMSEYYSQKMMERDQRKRQCDDNNTADDASEHVPKKRKLDDGTEIIEMAVHLYSWKNLKEGISPKVLLHQYTRDNRLRPPKFDTICRAPDRSFKSTVTVDDKKYTSTQWNVSKKWAEQSTAVVCLRTLGLEDGIKEITRRHKSQHNQTNAECQRKKIDKTELRDPDVKQDSENQKTLPEIGLPPQENGASNGCAESSNRDNDVSTTVS